MAAATQSILTNSSVNAIWRTVQGDLVPGINYMCEEYELLDDLQNLKVDASLRSMKVPVDILEGAGIASIPEGGYEARTYSPNAVEATVSFVHFNGRFNASKLSRWADAADGGAGEIEKQIVFQARHKIRDMARHVSDYFYGLSTAVLCQTSTVATQASGTYTLKNAYGSTTISGASTAEKNYICNMLKVGDYVALIRSSALVANAIGVITAVTPGTPSIAVTWAGSVTSANNDNIVKANSMEATTIAATDSGAGLVGLLDMCTTASVHGLSNATYADWDVAGSDTTGGRMSSVRYRKAKDEIANRGLGNADKIFMDQGVYRDFLASQQAVLRFNDPFALEVDGDLKGNGKRFYTSRRVPPGWSIFAVGKSLKKKTLLKRPEEGPSWSDGKELIDQSGWVFGIDLPMLMATSSRRSLYYLNGLTQQ